MLKDIKIIVVGVIPPIKQCEHENIHGPILHQFPFVGTDEDRGRFTIKVNQLIEKCVAIINTFRGCPEIQQW